MSKLVIASGNAGKLREIARILAPLGIEAVPQSQFQVAIATRVVKINHVLV